MTGDGPEPTGWELLRSIEGLREDIKEVGGRVLSVDVYNADKQGNDSRHERSEARLDLIERRNDDAEKLRVQQRITVSIGILSPLLAVAGAVLVKLAFP